MASTSSASSRQTRRALLATAAAGGAVAALKALPASADTAAGSPLLLGRKNGGPGVSAVTQITTSAGAGRPTLVVRNLADAGTGLRSIADLALDARGNVNVAGRTRLAGPLAAAGAGTATIATGNTIVIPLPGIDDISDRATIVASVNTAGAPAIASTVRESATSVRVNLASAVSGAVRVSVVVIEPAS